MTEPTAAPAPAAPASATPAAADTNPGAPAAPASSAPAASAGDANSQKNLNFLARLAGATDVVADLEGKLKAEQDAHAATKQTLSAVQTELQGYKDAESKLEQALASQKEAENAAAESKAEAEKVTAQIPAKVSEGVTAAVASLGVDPAALPAAQAEPTGAAATGEFGHLKGRDRAAAAFGKQLAELSGAK